MFVVNYMRTEYCTILHRAHSCLAEQGRVEGLIQALQLWGRELWHKYWCYICIYNLNLTQYCIIEWFGLEGTHNNHLVLCKSLALWWEYEI